jgi:hypothetical protein
MKRQIKGLSYFLKMDWKKKCRKKYKNQLTGNDYFPNILDVVVLENMNMSFKR